MSTEKLDDPGKTSMPLTEICRGLGTQLMDLAVVIDAVKNSPATMLDGTPRWMQKAIDEIRTSIITMRVVMYAAMYMSGQAVVDAESAAARAVIDARVAYEDAIEAFDEVEPGRSTERDDELRQAAMNCEDAYDAAMAEYRAFRSKGAQHA